MKSKLKKQKQEMSSAGKTHWTNFVLTPTEIKVVKLLEEEYSLVDIQRLTKVNNYYIKKLCDKIGIIYPKKQKEDITFKAISLLKNGMNGSSVAKQLGVSRQRINVIKDKALTYGII